ncbi:hypothetical protein ABZY02_35725 [Streptomyces sp. NPDC006649]
MTRLIPLVLIGFGVYFWFRSRRRTAAWLEHRTSASSAPSPSLEDRQES